jgi:hypothetical protein
MDSLPDQRIEALPGATRREAYWKIEALCYLRRQRTYSEHEIAKKAEFVSVEAMYHNLKTWGLTGLLPPEKQEETPRPKVEKPDRKTRRTGAPEGVPDPNAAAELFNEVLDELRESVKMLENLSLVYQGKRFVGAYTFENTSWVFSRSNYSEQEWRKLCKQHGRNPYVESFTLEDVSSEHSTEAGPYPPRELAALVAAYALSGRPIESLLEVSYPEHSPADVEKINKLVYETQSQGSKDGLLRTAQQLAAAAYGRKAGQGAPFELPSEKVQLARYITKRRQAGVEDEEIHQAILDSGRRLSKEDCASLAELGYRFPNT